MVRIAKERGIQTKIGKAEQIPFEDNHFDYAVMVTVDCFLDDITKAFAEVRRILKPGGEFIIGMIDKNSRLWRV
jgi:ubiquinone/menaquinone biosynthesis C-methylase UbiE